MSYNPRIKIAKDGSLIINGNVQLKAQSSMSGSTINTSYLSGSYLSSSQVVTSSINLIYTSGSGLTSNLNSVSSNITLNKSGHIVVLDANNQAIIVSLPSASQLPGQEYVFKRVDSSANSITVSGKINNITTQISLANKNDSLILLSDGSSSWWRI